jgi:hypothetical protein
MTISEHELPLSDKRLASDAGQSVVRPAPERTDRRVGSESMESEMSPLSHSLYSEHPQMTECRKERNARPISQNTVVVIH